MHNSFVIKGNICQTKTSKELDLHENAYVVCVDGVSKGVFEALPDEYADLRLYDYEDRKEGISDVKKSKKVCR